MIFTVVWLSAAENDLATLWTSGPDRNAIATAADGIDDQLRNDPLSAGESREGNVRILIWQPLVVEFTVSVPDRLVTVRGVGRWGRRP